MLIRIKDDFDIDKIIFSGQCFRPCIVNSDDKIYTYRFITKDHVLYMNKTDKNDTYEISCSKKEWEDIWEDYFDIKLDYSSVRLSIRKEDRYMIECADCGNGIRILNQDKWEMLISFIISQRKSIPAIRSCVEKLCERYGKKIKTDRESVYLFPTPDKLINVSQDELSECGLGYRVGYIMDAVKKVYFGEIDLELISDLDDESLYDELIKIKGVGTKVANCVMLFSYHRTGRAPVDVWIKRVIEEHYAGIDPFPSYKENAGIMQQYVFYHSINKKY